MSAPVKYLVFVPGIMGSGLRNSSGPVWPPRIKEVIFGYKRIGDLMGDDVQATDIIRNVGPKPVYRTLLDDIAVCGYGEHDTNRKSILFPYDWRRPNAETAGALADRLDAETDAEMNISITLLGHSMGGLVLRYLVESGDFDDRSWFSSIDRLITLASPHVGAPLALTRLRGGEGSLGVSAGDVYKLGNDKRYSSLAEMVGPERSAMTTSMAVSGNLPKILDPFSQDVAGQLKLGKDVVQKARRFWSKLDTAPGSGDIKYYCFASAAHKTSVRNEMQVGNGKPVPIDRKDSGDGTVPVASALLPGIPHAFSRKEHASVFEDRELRKYLYRILDSPGAIMPQSADGNADPGAADAVGISLDKESYDVGEPMEIALSFNDEVSLATEGFRVISYDDESGEPLDGQVPLNFEVTFRNVIVKELSFTAQLELKPGLYELRTLRDMDDPEPRMFFVRDGSDE